MKKMYFLSLITGLLTVNSFAQSGSLDIAFDSDGKLTTELGSSYDYGYSVAIQSDGKIIVVGTNNAAGGGDFAIIRYNSNGSLDNTFDGDGKAFIDIAGTDVAYSVVIQNDGKIVVAGYSTNNGNWDFALIRLNNDGSLDTSFDTDGKLLTDFGTEEQGASVAIQTDGKIIVAGYSGSGASQTFAVARYNSDGSLDNTFDGDGKRTTYFVSGQEARAYSVAIQSDGKIVVVGHSYYDFALVRYNSDGSLDNTFDTDGKVITSFGSGNEYGYSVAIQDDGKILIGGAFGGNFALARYNNDGSLDNTFDADGQVTTDFGGGDEVRSIAIQTDGKILAAGSSSNGYADFALARYNNDGSLDSTFDTDGKVTTNFTGGSTEIAYSIAIQADGKIVLAGVSALNGSYNNNVAVVRYNGDIGVGVNKTLIENLLTIYPNPTNDYLTIKNNNGDINTTYALFNSLGQRVLTGKLMGETTTVDVTKLASGLYFVQVDNEEKQTFKFMKK